MKITQLKSYILLAVVLMVGTGLYGEADPFSAGAQRDLADAEVLAIDSGTLELAGDRVFALEGVGVNATITIGATSTDGSLTIRPSTGADAQLLFDVVDATSTLEVHLLNDLLFTGNDTKPLFVSFRGKGKVRFRMPSGRTISFGSQVPGTSTVGTTVRVLMDQKKAQADEQAMVSFEKWSAGVAGTNTDLTKHTYIKFGQHSAFEFISQHATGLPPTDELVDYGYAAVEFDTSNEGSGRMILELARGIADGDFSDAAFNVYGSRVTGTGLTETDVVAADFRTQVEHKYRSGVQATVRVVDHVARDGLTGEALTTYLGDANNRRGLVVMSHNHTFPRLANNYDQTTASADPATLGDITDLSESMWFVANAKQPGFVLGNNGRLVMGHQCFLDYFACAANAANSAFPVAGTHVQAGATDGTSTHIASKVKRHNPAALIIDGHAYRVTGTVMADADANYLYDSSDVAQIDLMGNGGIYARVAASSDTDELMNLAMDADGTPSSTGVYIDGTIGKGTYDGISIPVLDGSVIADDQSDKLDGEFAIDVEGPVKVTGKPTTDDDVQPATGFINIPTVMLDHKGQELKFSGGTLSAAGSRPLSMASTDEYYRYNTSSVLVNDQVELESVTWVHNDVSRDLRTLPDTTGQPAIVGGELASLRVAKKLALNPSEPFLDYTGPRIFLDNATVACHESLVSAGVRWVVRDGLIDEDAGDTVTAGDNSSTITMYNRGRTYDQDLLAQGRVFQLGSRSNVMADGSTNDPIVFSDDSRPQSSLRDAFIDVYRQDPLPTSMASESNTIKLTLSTAQESGVDAADRAIQVVYLADRSQVNLGWPSGQYDKSGTTVCEVDSRYRPWEFSKAALDYVVGFDAENEEGYRFSPFAQGVGELSVAGHNIYIDAGGKYDATGVNSDGNENPPTRVSDSGGIVYVDHGGKLSTGGSFDMMLDTIVAVRTSVVDNASGVLALNSDQIITQKYGKIEAYGYDATLNTLPQPVQQPLPHASFHVPDMPVRDDFSPIKGGIKRRGFDSDPRRSFYRATDSVTAPVPMPSSGLLVMNTGDALEQAQVSGATRANPFHLWLTGDTLGFARVREFVSTKSDPAVLGEGAHAALFLSGGARIGLGSRKINEHSVHAWNQLGQDKVSLFVDGNAVVDLNEDLIVTDRLPIVATENFGMSDKAHQLRFHSEMPREIRIMDGGELDLSSFGRSNGFSQQIAFSGNVSLVIEAGGKIRFPQTLTGGDPDNAPILYFTDNAKLIFLGNMDRDEGRWVDGLTGSDKVRCKMLGTGKIWLNKQARCEIFDEALVGIESDAQTPDTNITISIKRQAGMFIGDANRAGGAFQIGNMVDGGGDGTNIGEGAIATSVSFNLALDGPDAQFHINREGFFGLGAGTVNKFGTPNGTATSSTDLPENDTNTDAVTGELLYLTAWRIQSLHNVKNITLDIQRGKFDHNQIFDGSKDAGSGSVMAIGPLGYNSGRYTINLGKSNEAFIRGGGNIVFIDAGVPHTDPKALSVWNTSTNLTETGNTGKYTILVPSTLLRTYTTPLGGETITAPDPGTAYSFASSAVSDVTTQGAALIELYNTLSMPVFSNYRQKYVPAGLSNDGVVAAFLASDTSLANEIVRQLVTTARDYTGRSVSPERALDAGYFIGTSVVNSRPGGYGVPKE